MRPLSCAVFALVGGAITLGGAQAIEWALHHLGFPVSEQDAVEVAFKVLDRWSLLGAIGFCAPLGEELLFRRIGFAALVRGTNRPIAYGLTMLAFATVHLNPSAFVIYLWIGFVAAFAYDRTGRIEVSIAIHAMNNIVAVLVATRPQ
jgi:membrane protease YdiL (CAAX protease family)